MLKIYKVYIYHPIEQNKKSNLNKKGKKFLELTNIAKYYREKLL